jgi:hypothetical protein
MGMVSFPANRRLRVVRVVYSRPRESMAGLLSGGVVGSSVAFWALGICVLNCTMGGGSSATLLLWERFMLAMLASVASGREDVDGEVLSAWAVGASLV